MPLAGKKVVIVGLGKSGMAAARFAAASDVAQILVTDMAPEATLTVQRAQLAHLPITYCLGGHDAMHFTAADLIVVSPGVPLDRPELAAARAAHVPIVSEMELALHAVGAEAMNAHIVAITGTNGKSTTTALLGAMLAAADRSVVVGGNIGTPLLDLLTEIAEVRHIVLEVSSYQIETTPSLVPATTVLLNLTPDHLDRYGDFASYRAAKQQLLDRLGSQQTLIYNDADPVVREMAQASRAHKIPFTIDDATYAAGHAAPASTASVRGEAPSGSAGGGGRREPPIIDDATSRRWNLQSPYLQGVHNQENMIAAAVAADALGIVPQAIEMAVQQFTGLPHRCRLVHTWHDIAFYDDSKGTNVGAVEKSLAGFTAPVILIAGGLDKGTGYESLRRPVQERVKALILLGQARVAMHAELGACTTTYLVDSMADAVRRAVNIAAEGDVVLLSPACASFDMYKNYAERGDDFAHCVRKLTSN